VDTLLRTCGLEAEERRLRDENQWFSYEKKVRMLTPPQRCSTIRSPRHIGEAALDFDVGQMLKLSLRALGSLRLLYKNIVYAMKRTAEAGRAVLPDVLDAPDPARLDSVA
jgi:hypothetical protein